MIVANELFRMYLLFHKKGCQTISNNVYISQDGAIHVEVWKAQPWSQLKAESNATATHISCYSTSFITIFTPARNWLSSFFLITLKFDVSHLH